MGSHQRRFRPALELQLLSNRLNDHIVYLYLFFK